MSKLNIKIKIEAFTFKLLFFYCFFIMLYKLSLLNNVYLLDYKKNGLLFFLLFIALNSYLIYKIKTTILGR